MTRLLTVKLSRYFSISVEIINYHIVDKFVSKSKTITSQHLVAILIQKVISGVNRNSYYQENYYKVVSKTKGKVNIEEIY